MNDSKKTTETENITADAKISLPLAELIKIRHDKAIAMRQKGLNPYPYKYDKTHDVNRVLEQFDQFAEEETIIRLAGRMMLKRKMGKSIFADLRDTTDRLQIYVKLNNVGQEQFELFDSFDLGDILGCEGTLFVTRTGEKTLKITSFELLTKSLHPLPDKHAGLTDKETRYRRRYVDLAVNPEVREVFVQRTKIVQYIRDYINEAGFLEVETPILQPIYGGAMAKPFITHHNRLDIPMYMRIADELYLKRLIVGGYDKVWEYCKDFRNEGLDRLHNPEFSMIELYWAYADYKDIANLLEDMLRTVVYKLHNSYKITYGENEIDFEPKFRWVSMLDSIKEQSGVDFADMSFEEAKKAAVKLGSDPEGIINWGKAVEAAWELAVEPTLVEPTFIADFPVDISPLAKKHRTNDRLTERFELFIAGQEVGNAFSELNDPVDQLRRFLQQGKAIEAGDEAAQPLDDDFVTALAYGMPPTGGLGFGVDRLVMLLTNQHSIRDVIFFPQMKQTKEGTVLVSKILTQLIDDET